VKIAINDLLQFAPLQQSEWYLHISLLLFSKVNFHVGSFWSQILEVRFYWVALYQHQATNFSFLKVAHTSRFFCRRTADFLSGSNRVKICRAISLPHTSRFFVTTNRVEAWGRVIQNQDSAYSTHVTLVTFLNWLRRARAPTNCLGPPHTSRQGPTRRFEIFQCQISPGKPRPCRRLVWIHRTLAGKWRFFVGRQKLG